MRLVIQRVKEARVVVQDRIVGEIKKGILIFLGVEKTDDQNDVTYLIEKVTNLRIFEDDQGKMNLSALDVRGDFLVVSQFTLLGDCHKGRRPSFDQAAMPEIGEKIYTLFVERLRTFPLKVETGQFRAMMDVYLVNDGPVTFVLESKDQ